MSEKAKPKKADPEIDQLDLEIALAEKIQARIEARMTSITKKLARSGERLESLKKIRERLGG